MASYVVATNTMISLMLDATVGATSAPFSLTQSPLLPGRKIRWRSSGSAATIKFQTAPKIDPATGLAPIAGSALWTDVTVVPAAVGGSPAALVNLPTLPCSGEMICDYWLRTVISGSAGAAVTPVILEGIP
jgi:hypothetical protein